MRLLKKAALAVGFVALAALLASPAVGPLLDEGDCGSTYLHDAFRSKGNYHGASRPATPRGARAVAFKACIDAGRHRLWASAPHLSIVALALLAGLARVFRGELGRAVEAWRRHSDVQRQLRSIPPRV